MTMLEDPNNRGSDTIANDVECHKTQEDQNQRRAVVTRLHDDTTEYEVQNKFKSTCIPASHRHRRKRQICQIIEHTEETVEKKENKDITSHGCMGDLNCCTHTRHNIYHSYRSK